jgi:hypothetical protein
MNILRENIILIQSYYKFLLVGKYLEDTLKRKDFSEDIKKVRIKTWTNSNFDINTKHVKNILHEIHEKPDQKNVFGYLVEMSAIKWILSTTRETMENNESFLEFVSERLQKEFFDFDQILRLTRNILSHSTTANANIKHEDFEKQKSFLEFKKNTKLNFEMKYSTYFTERKWNPDYQIKIELDIEKLKEWKSIFEYISMHQLYLLCEFCFNLSEIFRKYKKIK